MACNLALGITALWCISSILLLAINCDDEAAIGLETGNCPGLVSVLMSGSNPVTDKLELARWTVVGVLDGIIELLIFSLSVTVIWPLQMNIGRRLSALGCFFFRLP